MKTKEGLWKLTPSGLYSYEECKSCFWLEQHIGRPPSIPMRLNDAMDSKLKHRYDGFREAGKLPPEISELKGIRLFDDFEILDAWRSSTAALRFVNEKDSYVLEGKLDDVLMTDKGEHIPIDFKSSGDAPKADKQKYYRLQLHAYALMLREKGYKPANKAFLVHYFTKDRTEPSLTMEFKSHLDEVAINLPAFEKTLKDMVKLLDGDWPKAGELCQKCAWQTKRAELKTTQHGQIGFF